jgi:predicted metal-dependent hydrolase
MNAKVNISNRAGASFPVRRMDFEFGEVPRYWANGDAALTHFMTALSALFPEGEQFFVNSTRAVRNDPKLADPRLQKKLVLLLDKKQCIQRNTWLLMQLLKLMVMMCVNWRHKQVK